MGRLTMFIVLAFLFTTLPKMTERLRNVRSRALGYGRAVPCVYALLHSLVSGDTLLFSGSVTRVWAQPSCALECTRTRRGDQLRGGLTVRGRESWGGQPFCSGAR